MRAGAGGAASAEEEPVPRIKFCGLTRREDVETASETGATHVGFVLAESPRRLAPEDAAILVLEARRRGLSPVGVFVDRDPAEVADLASALDLGVVQLHGSEGPEACEGLGASGLEVWKAVRPRSRSELAAEVERYEGAADALLVEGRSSERAGGTGTAFPHRWLEAGGAGPRPGRLVLAGGLDPENVAEAVRLVRPDVVDVSSGVERSPGVKDGARMRAFARAVRSALPEGAGAGEEHDAEAGGR